MIIVGHKKIRLLNPAQIISLELTKGRVSAYVKGKVIKNTVTVEDLSVREPWSVVIQTSTGNSYINCADFEKALQELICVAVRVDEHADIKEIEKNMRRAYGQEKIEKS